MEDQSNSQRAMQQNQQQQHHGGTELQHLNMDASGGGNFGANNTSTMFQQQQQNPDTNSHNQNGGVISNSNGNNSLNISAEIKRLQQLHQLSAGGNPSNALLMNPGSGSHDPSAFLQSMLAAQNGGDQQQKTNLSGNNNRFENSLAGGGNGNPMIGSNTSNTMPAPTPANAPAQNAINPMQLPSNFLNDARLLMAQNQVFQNQGMPFAMMPQQPQQQQAQQQQGRGAIGQNQEMPLPSPHSLFHRDGSRRMRGGVIEPFPGMYAILCSITFGKSDALLLCIGSHFFCLFLTTTEKLHRLLMEVEAAGRSDVISFVASGRAFAIHKADKFFKEIVPLYFRQSRLSSFKRQLNLYGFELINTGPARGGYYHELFVREKPELCRRMRRVAVKVGSDAKKAHKSVDPITDTKPKAEDGGHPPKHVAEHLSNQQHGDFHGES